MKVNKYKYKFILIKIFLCIFSFLYLIKSQNQNQNQNETITITNKNNDSIINNEEANIDIDINNNNLNQKEIEIEKDNGFIDGFFSGFSIVFFSEIGDRTFILIMIYSISNNNNYLKTFLISNLVLITWNLISILIGLNMKYYINKAFFEYFGIIFFAVFGFIMIYDGLKMKSKLIEEEFFEEEENLRKKAQMKYLSFSTDENKSLLFISKINENQNQNQNENENNLNESFLKKNENTNNNIINLFDSIWAFCFTLIWTEISDKSQIAAIIIGATLDLFGVILGTSLAHMICSIIAIAFGRIFSHYITIKQITLIGGIIFVLFSLLFLLEKL
jgi:putative Ca2+/H+ antiporter (TMEM165/GDT1 family)